MIDEKILHTQSSHQNNMTQMLYSAVDHNDFMSLKKIINDSSDEYWKKSIFKIEY